MFFQPPRSGPPPDPLGPRVLGPKGTQILFERHFFTFRGGRFCWYIYNASALKRIIANHLGYKVYQPLKFEVRYYWGAMLNKVSLRHVTSRHVTWHSIYFGTRKQDHHRYFVPIMGEFLTLVISTVPSVALGVPV